MKSVIVYFTHSGNTELAAKQVAEATGARMIKLLPEQPYSSEDVNWTNKQSRCTQEHLNRSLRPAIKPIDIDCAKIDTLVVGFPIWWYDLPMPVWSFLEEYDLSGKTIIPFFTHNGSSSGASSISTVAELCPDSTVLTDDYFTYSGNNVDEAESAVDEWLTELGYNN